MKILKKVSKVSTTKQFTDVSTFHKDAELPRMALKTLSVAIASALVAAIAPVTYADTNAKMIGDLEIYKAPEQGSASLMMMLDTSGSMGAFDNGDCNGYSIYTYQLNIVVKKDDGTDGETISYNLRGCDSGLKYDRLSKLKKALLPIFADPKQNLGSDYKNYKIGFGTFVESKTGKIANKAAELTYENRLKLIKQLATMTNSGLTPSANAYAEAGAYMLGTTTKSGTPSVYKVKGWTRRYKRSGYNHYGYEYHVCNFNSNAETSLGDIKVQACTGSSYINRVHWYTYFPYSVINFNFIKSNFGNSNANLMGTVDSYYVSGNIKYFLETVSGGDNYSGFPYSINTSKVQPEQKKYDSPLSTGGSQCSGNGIYFLTDGLPNTTTDKISTTLMNESLKTSSQNLGTSNICNPIQIKGGAQFLTEVGTGSENLSSGWECMGAYAKILNSKNHVKKSPIKTATVGFGGSFSSLSTVSRPVYDDKGVQLTDPVTGLPMTKEVNNCSSASNQDARNLCYLGEETYGFGEGGFTATSTPEGIRDSLVKFLASLNTEIGSTPTGIIVVPDDPYNASSQQAVAFYPTVDSQSHTAAAIWKGNMKKYSLKEGTLYGKNDGKLFLDIAGALDAGVQDLWSDRNYTASGKDNNNSVASGGFYVHLNSPKDGLTSLRNLYIEDWNSTSDKKPVLRKFAVNDSGKLTLDDVVIGSSNYFIDTDTYTPSSIKALLSFLGFNNISPNVNTPAKIIALTLTEANNASEKTRVLGASMHSKPALVSYSANLEANGSVGNERDEYVLFGSMDGALHLVDSDDNGDDNGGKEVFSFIPREIVKNQPEALIHNQTHGKIGAPKMGMDAPWLVNAEYDYDLDDSEVASKNMYAYGGMRMGGVGLYGMNLNQKNSPKLLFTLAPEYDNTGNRIGDFKHMGQIWAKPTLAKIRMSSNSNDKGTDVLVFGGGYDTCYEYQDYQVGISSPTLPSECASQTQALGNAVYIVNALTGELIWSASNKDSSSDNASMTNSIVGGVTILDRNDDGYMDHIYFADLGGQVFRADFKNAGFKDKDGNIESSFSNQRVIKILDNAHPNSKYAYRFYERPVVSFYRNSITKKLFAMVNVISGDRSSPLSTMRKDNKYADRIYGIMDTDVTKKNNILFSQTFDTDGTGRGVYKIDTEDLYNLSEDGDNDGDGTLSVNEKKEIINKLKAYHKQGWYYPLTRFDGLNKVKYTKGVGKSEVIGGLLFTTTYNPDMVYGEKNSCSADVVGGSERQLYCLPYGICTNGNSKNGTGGFIPAGKGIRELVVGPLNSKNNRQRLLIGTKTIDEREDGRIDFGEQLLEGDLFDKQKKDGNNDITNVGADGTSPLYIFNERYTFNPTKWYESSEE